MQNLWEVGLVPARLVIEAFGWEYSKDVDPDLHPPKITITEEIIWVKEGEEDIEWDLDLLKFKPKKRKISITREK